MIHRYIGIYPAAGLVVGTSGGCTQQMDNAAYHCALALSALPLRFQCMWPTSNVAWKCGVTTKDGDAQIVTINWPRHRLRPSVQRHQIQTRDPVNSVWVTEDDTLYATLEYKRQDDDSRDFVRVYSSDGTLAGEYGTTEPGLTAPTISEEGKHMAFLTEKGEVIVGTRKAGDSYAFESRASLPDTESVLDRVSLTLFASDDVLFASGGKDTYEVDLNTRSVRFVAAGRHQDRHLRGLAVKYVVRG